MPKTINKDFPLCFHCGKKMDPYSTAAKQLEDYIEKGAIDFPIVCSDKDCGMWNSATSRTKITPIGITRTYTVVDSRLNWWPATLTDENGVITHMPHKN